MGKRFDPAVPVPRLGSKLNILYGHGAGPDGHAALGRLFRRDPADPESGISGKAIVKWIEGEGDRAPDHVPAARWDRLIEVYRRRLPGRRSQGEVCAILAQDGTDALMTAFLDRPPAVDWVERAMCAPPAPVAIVRAPAPGTMAITGRNRASFADECAVRYPARRDFRFLMGDVPNGWLISLQWDARSGWFGMDLADEGEGAVEVAAGGFLPASSPFLIEHEAIDRAYFFVCAPFPLPSALVSQAMLSARAGAPLDAAFLQRLAQQLDAPGTTLTRLAVSFRE